MEQVLSGSNKVLLDTKGSGNNMVYLPLDKLIEQQRGATTRPPGAGTAAGSEASAQQPVPVDIVDPRARGVR
jgi:modulator of FtsH protease HflK